jgi:hypothetical protein
LTLQSILSPSALQVENNVLDKMSCEKFPPRTKGPKIFMLRRGVGVTPIMTNTRS